MHLQIPTARYLDPSYTVNFENGRGLKLVGNIEWGGDRGFLGHIANSIHPLHDLPHQNAKFDLKQKFSTDNTGRIIKNMFCAGNFGLFPLIALRDIGVDEEIIVDYSKGYWKAMDEWISNPKFKSQSVIDRDLRMKRRHV